MSFFKQFISKESEDVNVDEEAVKEENAEVQEEENLENTTTEEATNLDDSETPASGGTRLEHYRRIASEVEEKAEDAVDEVTEAEDEIRDESANAEGEEKSEENESDDKEADKEDSEEKEEDSKDEPSDEEKEKTAEALESLRDEIMVSYQKGGMTEAEASIVNTSVESLLFSVGMASTRVVSSLECYSENSTRRLLSTSLTIDNLNNVIDQLRGK